MTELVQFYEWLDADLTVYATWLANGQSALTWVDKPTKEG